MSAAQVEDRSVSFGEFVLDERRAALYRNGIAVALRPKCFEVLRLLVVNAGRVVTKDELLDAVWSDVVVTEQSVAQCIAEIRRAVGDSRHTLIRTVPRRGFIFELPVVEGPARPSVTASNARRQRIVWFAGLGLLASAAWWSLTPTPRELAAPQSTDSTIARAPQGSIAVLRFADMSPAGDQAYFADGLAEEILHLLAQSPDLRVTARTSSFAFAPGEADVETIAGMLNVAHVLEGSVRRDGSALRVTAQLIDGGSGTHVWSNAYDREFASVLQLQQEIAGDVGAALQAAIAPTARASTPLQAESHDLFLLARHQFHRRGPGDLAAAEQHLERAVALDPANAAAWTALAGVYNVRGFEELSDGGYRLEDQRRALERALQIDPSIAEAHVRLGRYHTYTGDETAGHASFNRACELAPDDPLVLKMRAARLVVDGRLEDAVELDRRAVAVNPLSAIYRRNLGMSLLGTGRWDEALAELYRAREFGEPNDPVPGIAPALLLLGRIDAAWRATTDLEPGPERDKLLVMLGVDSETQLALARLEADDSARGRLRVAEIAAFQGRPDEAFAQLDAIVALHHRLTRIDPDFRVWFIMHVSPFIGLLRSDPRWSGVVEQVRRIVSIERPVVDTDGTSSALQHTSACSALLTTAADFVPADIAAYER